MGCLTMPAAAQYPPYPVTPPSAGPGTSSTAPLDPQALPVHGPTAPTAPSDGARPANWPGGPQDPTRYPPPQAYPPPNYAQPPLNVPPPGFVVPVNPPPAYAPPVAQPVATHASAPRRSLADPPYDPADVLARVGSEVVQANELLPNIRKYIGKITLEHADQLAQLSPEDRARQILALERAAMQQSVPDAVKLKLVLSEIRSEIPKEGLDKNEERIRNLFNEAGIKSLLEAYEAENVVDLENKLRALGSSLDAQRQLTVEQYLVSSWLREQVRGEPEPTHAQLLTYYREHPEEWETPARARWEHLLARFDRFPDTAAAFRALAQWGNAIQGGAPFAEVARANSHDFSAAQGGMNDWTTQGSLRSAAIDTALFQLPVGQLSPIIEDEDGFHIVRVVERTPLLKAGFAEVQDQIREKLQQVSQKEKQDEYIENLRKRIPVWTVFDDPGATLTARPAAPDR